MKKFILVTALLLSSPLFGQVTTGYHRTNQVTARATGGSNLVVQPFAKVYVTSTATNTVATIYSDPLLSVSITGATVTADANGNYSYYIPLNYCVNERVDYPGSGSVTTTNICSYGGASGPVPPGQIIPGTNGQILQTIGGTTAWHTLTYTDITNTWAGGSCVGYLKSDGTCSITTFEHNGVPLPVQDILNFLDTPPTLPTGYTAVTFANDGAGGLGGYVPPADVSSGIRPYLAPPIPGQWVIVYPTALSFSAMSAGALSVVAGTGTKTASFYNGKACSLGGGTITATFTGLDTALAALGIPLANVTHVYPFAYSGAPFGGVERVCGPLGSFLAGPTSENLIISGDATGLSSVALGTPHGATGYYAIGELVGVNAGNIPTASFSAAASVAGTGLTSSSSGLLVGWYVYYTGTAVAQPDMVQVLPPLNYDSSTNILSVLTPLDTNGIDTGSVNAYAMAIPWLGLNFNTTVKFQPNNTSTSTAPTFSLNGGEAMTIVGPTGASLAVGDLVAGVPATIVYGTGFVWYLQNPQVSGGGGGGTTTNALTAAATGGAAPGTTFNGSTARTFDYHSFGAPGISGTPTTGNCVDWASANTLGDAGAPCGSGGGSSVGTAGQLQMVGATAGSFAASAVTDDGTTVTVSEPLAVDDATGAGGGLDGTEGTAQTPAAGHDIIYADSASHCFMYSANGAAFSCLAAGAGIASINSQTGPAINVHSSDSSVTVTTTTNDIDLTTAGGVSGVQYNPATTSYIVTSFSGLYDDNRSKPIAGAVTSYSCVHTTTSTCTMNFASAHGLVVGGAIDPDQLTGWPYPNYQGAQFGSFQVTTVPTSTSLTFTTPTVLTATCASACGTAYDASYWIIWTFARQPYIYGHGTVWGIETTSQSLDTNFASLTAGMAGTPTILIDGTGVNDFAAGSTVSQVETWHENIWQHAHAQSPAWKVMQTTLIPAKFGILGQGTKLGEFNIWMWAQSTTSTSAALGKYFDYYADPASAVAVGYGIGTAPDEDVAQYVASTLNNAIASQSSTAPFPPTNFTYSGSGNNNVPGLFLNRLLVFDPASPPNQWLGFSANGLGNNHVDIDGASVLLNLTRGGMSTGTTWCADLFGADVTNNNNSFAHCFHLTGSGSTSNYMSVAPFGGTDVFRAYATGEVSFPGVATSPSTAPACFNGTHGGITNVGCSGGGGTGDVVGPASSTADDLATYADTTGKLIKDSGIQVSSLAPKASPAFSGTPDASAATAIKLPVSAGCVATAQGNICYDSTNKNWHLWVNGVDKMLIPLAAGFTSGHCGQPTLSGTSWEIQDAGGVCGVSGGGSAFSAITTGSNTTATMTVGTGGSIVRSGSGIVDANQLLSVPFCTGFTPTTGQALTYTTASSPNPCYTAATASGSSGFTAPAVHFATSTGAVANTSVSSVTSAAATYTANDVIVAFVRTNTVGNTCTFTSTPSATWHALTAQNGSGAQSLLMGWAIAPGGSTTVTCTLGSADTFTNLITLDLANVTGTLNTSAGAAGGAGTPVLVSGLNPTGRTFNILCAGSNANGNTYTTIPLIAGNQSPTFSTDSNNFTGQTSICAGSPSYAALTGMSGTVTYGSAATWGAVLAAFDY
jgi:hypothetical protein